jgi:hypothetical protein
MLHKQFEELTETGDEHAGIFFLNHATTYNNASVKVNPDPPPPPHPTPDKEGIWWLFVIEFCPKHVGNLLVFSFCRITPGR